METRCPCCGRHCAADDLHCPRGRAYFAGDADARQDGHDEHHHGERHEGGHPTQESGMIALLRRCGHYLHHSAGHGTDAAQLASVLTEQEQAQLSALLEKCLNGWENQGKA